MEKDRPSQPSDEKQKEISSWAILGVIAFMFIWVFLIDMALNAKHQSEAASFAESQGWTIVWESASKIGCEARLTVCMNGRLEQIELCKSESSDELVLERRHLFPPRLAPCSI